MVLSPHLAPLAALAARLGALFARSCWRTLHVEVEHRAFVARHLREHGIDVAVRRGALAARLRPGREQSDLFLVEFVEFMVNSPASLQGQWLEFCLGLTPLGR